MTKQMSKQFHFKPPLIVMRTLRRSPCLNVCDFSRVKWKVLLGCFRLILVTSLLIEGVTTSQGQRQKTGKGCSDRDVTSKESISENTQNTSNAKALYKGIELSFSREEQQHRKWGCVISVTGERCTSISLVLFFLFYVDVVPVFSS